MTQNTQYNITWETWNNMITNLGKAEARLEKALELIETMIESADEPQELDRLLVWKKCIHDHITLKRDMEEYV
jgi:uncharacterized protein YukE